MAKSKKNCGCEKENKGQKDKGRRIHKEDLLWVFFCIKMHNQTCSRWFSLTLNQFGGGYAGPIDACLALYSKINEIMGDPESRKKLMDARKGGIEDIFELSVLEPLVKYPKLPPLQPQANKTPPGSAVAGKPSGASVPPQPPKPGKAPPAK